MNFYFSYKVLEKRINEIKYDVESLWSVVDQFSEVTEVKVQVEKEEDVSERESCSSYHTAVCASVSTLDSYVTAIECWEENQLEEVCDSTTLSVSINEVSKKTVSFSGQVTVLDVSHKNDRRKKTKEKISNIKNKFIDYLQRERFYLKYKWHKFKYNIKNNSKSNEDESRIDNGCDNLMSKEIIPRNKENATKVVNLQLFFNETNSNFILETDIDYNCHSLVYKDCKFPQTDLTSPILTQNSISEFEEERSEKEIIKVPENIKKSYKTNMIEPKFLNQYTKDPEVKPFCCDLLYKYLVSKAQYPIQLQIANSIVKLNLPIWYQASLIV